MKHHFRFLSVEALARRLQRAGRWGWRGLVGGFGGMRLPRYTALGVIGVALIWVLAIAYLSFSPKVYQSGFMLVLPGAGAGTSVSLDAIGQASSLSESPFSNHRVNPTESYKRLILSDRVRNAAGAIAAQADFPLPRVKLLDQTQFMEVSVSGASPEQAHRLAAALEQAFLAEVDKLRIEERRVREEGYRAMTADFEQGVSHARQAILAHQSASGLASLDQFDQTIKMADNLEAEYEVSLIDLAGKERRRDELLAILGLEGATASVILQLSADPVFKTLADAYAERTGEIAALSHKFGENHPEMIRLRRELAGIADEIRARGRTADIDVDSVMPELVRMTGPSDYADMLTAAIAAHTDYQVAVSRSQGIGEQLQRVRGKLRSLSDDAAKLDDLNRAFQVAEAVFRSAVARIETNKTDLFASYPLIQTVEPPYVPASPSSPLPMLAIAGAMAASIFFIMGLCLACLRLSIINILLKRN